jgi:hypothetical protein
MFEIYTTGTLGLNNAGRMDKAIRQDWKTCAECEKDGYSKAD